jgi:hypothetical protein
MVDAPRPGITPAEIAAKYQRSEHTVADYWAVHPEWPAPVGKRGRAAEYDPDAVEAVVRRLFLHDPADIAPGKLYTVAEAAEVLGIKPGTVRSAKSRGRWPAADEVRDGVELWSGRTLAGVAATRARRGAR